MRKLFITTALISFIFLYAAPQTFAECKGDLNCDSDVDGSDLADFVKDYGKANCPDCIPAPVAQTGETTADWTGDDGDLQKGVAWPVPRFTNNGDGTVTDNLTGLIWLQNANCFGKVDYLAALTYSNTLNSPECGLSDGSAEGDWRLPNVKELLSLIDYGREKPALPAGHPFAGVQFSYPSFYFSSTSLTHYVDMSYGFVPFIDDDNPSYVWPVRGGN